MQKRIRAGKYRLIYTYQEEILLITIIEKRETVYQTFAHLETAEQQRFYLA
jgi:mRNA-degrading endonuclease RelE of RelBE toxin-antitoxin system